MYLKTISRALSVIIYVAQIPCMRSMISPLPSSEIYEACIKSFRDPQTTEEQKDFACTATEKWQTGANETPVHVLSDIERSWINTLVNFDNLDGRLRFQCERKEYRLLTDLERRRYHDAVKLLKSTKLDNGVSQYDVFVKIHTAAVAPGAHGGTGFLPWHRELLKRYELALRTFDPSVCLPYWDNSIDKKLDNPQHSIIWSDNFLGNGNGFVRSGPFARWRTTISGGTLDRNIESTSSNLMSGQFIENILRRSSLANISCATNCDFEAAHSGVHLFVGGKMASLMSSPEDPIFFMHHAFLDCIWEEFRDNQGSFAFNDYPSVNFGNSASHPQSPMEPFLGLKNIDGISSYSPYYRCSPRPSCSNLPLGSKYLRCEQDGIGIPRVMTTKIDLKSSTCKQKNDQPQNSYCVNGKCDTSLWSYIPISIVNVRSRWDSNSLYSSPVRNDHPLLNMDVYTGLHFSTDNGTSNSCGEGTTCCKHNRGVYLHATGLNYEGSYKEFVYLDPRLPISSSEACVAVPDPQKFGSLKVRVRAADSCGRVCVPYCGETDHRNQFVPGSFKRCNGDILVDTRTPHMYSSSFKGAMNARWKNSDKKQLPVRQYKYDFVTFYCNHGGQTFHPQHLEEVHQPNLHPSFTTSASITQPQIIFPEEQVEPILPEAEPEIIPKIEPSFPTIMPEYTIPKIPSIEPELDPVFPELDKIELIPERSVEEEDISNWQPEFPSVEPHFPQAKLEKTSAEPETIGVEPEISEAELNPHDPKVEPESLKLELDVPTVEPIHPKIRLEAPKVDKKSQKIGLNFSNPESKVLTMDIKFPENKELPKLPVYPNIQHKSSNPKTPNFDNVEALFSEVSAKFPKFESEGETELRSTIPGASLNSLSIAESDDLESPQTVKKASSHGNYQWDRSIYNYENLRKLYNLNSVNPIQSKEQKQEKKIYSSNSAYPLWGYYRGKSAKYYTSLRSKPLPVRSYWPRSYNRRYYSG